jgi:hypothetical protein
VLVAPLPAALAVANIRDPMQGGHSSQSVDLLSLVVDGGHWRFARLTRWYWGSGPPGIAESTIYLSVTVTVLIGVAMAVRRRLGPHASFWLALAAVTAILSLGPTLVVHGTDTGIPLPFALLRAAVPILDYNLEPARIVVMTTVAAAVLVALVLSRLDPARRRHQLVTGVVCAALIVELWPASPPQAPVRRPRYVAALSRLPSGGVIDDAAVANGRVDRSLQLYDQVLDGQPVAFGYISRTPSSVAAAAARLQAVIAVHDYAALCHRYGFRYFTTTAGRPLPGSLPILYDDGQAIIYGVCQPVAR